jgi:hypothetical protein
MELSSFAFVHWSYYERIKEMNNCQETAENIKGTVENDFRNAYESGSIGYSSARRINVKSNQADFAWFKTTYKNSDGDFLWFKFEKNTKQNAQEWFCSALLPQEDAFRELICSQYFVIGDILFPDINQGFEFLEELQSVAQPEEWKYKDYTSPINYPILKSYMEHTYNRLKAEGKVIVSNDNTQFLFNTGLLDRDFLLDVCILCSKTEVDIFGEKFICAINPRIVLENDISIIRSFGGKTPDIAKYFTTIDQVIFNPDLEINMNWRHIFIERVDRIPAEIVNGKIPIKEIVQKFKGNEENIKKLAKRNYKMVVPQYYNNSIQFLMPIYLGTEYDGKPDFALVLSMDNSTGEQFYRGTTILTVEMAYQNARLLAKPDNPWLISSLEK